MGSVATGPFRCPTDSSAAGADAGTGTCNAVCLSRDSSKLLSDWGVTEVQKDNAAAKGLFCKLGPFVSCLISLGALELLPAS